MKLQKRLLALLMAVLMMVSLFPLQTFAADGDDVKPETETSESAEAETEPAESTEPETGEPEILLSGDCSESGNGSVTYTLTSDGVLRISGAGRMKDYSNSESPWFGQRPQVTSLVVEDGVTYIGNYAFQSCSFIESAELPESLTGIGIRAFYNCTSLASGLSLPNLRYVGQYAFSDCKKLSGELVFPEGCTSIGMFAFANCIGLEGLSLPSTLSITEQSVFKNCSGLKKITFAIGSNTRYYVGNGSGYWTFSGCTGVRELVFTGDKAYAYAGCYSGLSGVRTIWVPKSLYGEYAEGLKTFLPSTAEFRTIDEQGEWATLNGVLISYQGDDTQVVLPDGITEIGHSAFRNNKTITKVTIPDSVRTIGAYAFSGCTALTEVNIPAGLASIGAYAFNNCSALTGGLLLPNSLTVLGQYAFNGCANLSGALTLPSGLTEIPQYAFSGCSGFEGTLLIPESVTTIGSSAFSGNAGLTAIDFGSRVSSVDSTVFSGCTEVERVTLRAATVPSGLYLNGMSKLSGVYVPQSAYSAYADALYGKLPSSAQLYCYDFTGDLLLDENGVLLRYFGSAAEVELPDTVTEIGKNAFRDLAVVSVTIPDTVTKLDTNAFFGCTALTEISIASTVKKIGDGVFSGCTALTEVTIPASVTEIGTNVFSNCTSLTGITIQSALTELPAGTFSGCTGLTAFSVPAGMARIGNSAFSGCTGLVTVTIPESVTEIGSKVFYGCTSLETATLPESLQTLGSYAFYNCSKLTGTAVIPDGNTEVPEYVYYNCKSITALAPLPESITSIGQYAFYYCSSMKGTLSFQPGFQSVGYAAFRGCKSLTGQLVLPEGISLARECFESCSGFTGELVIPGSVGTLNYDVFNGCYGISSLVLSEGVSRAFDRSLTGLGNLDSIVLPKSFTSAGSYSYSSCFGSTNTSSVTLNHTSIDSALFKKLTSFGNLKTVYVPAESYDYYVSTHKSSLNSNVKLLAIGDSGEFQIRDGVLVGYLGEGREVVIPNTVVEIGNAAFAGNTDITSVVIPDSVKTIGENAFSGCSALQTVQMSQSLGAIGNKAFFQCTSLEEIVIPASVASFGTSAFEECAALRSITVQNGVAEIGQRAFYSCTALEEIALPDSVTSVGASAFYGCIALRSAVLSDSMTEVPASCFYGCTSLESVSLPAQAETISDSAFQNCKKLQAVEFPEYLLSIGKNAFYSCGSLTTPDFPESLRTIDGYAFYQCSGLTGNLVFPNQVTTIGNCAFGYCSGLTSVDFGSAVEKIGTSSSSGYDNNPFMNCTGLTKAIFRSTDVPAVFGFSSFINRLTIILVPSAGYGQYASSFVWSMNNTVRMRCWDNSNEFVVIDHLFVAYQGNGTTVALPQNVTEIGPGAFLNCRSIQSVEIPQGITDVGALAFSRCSSLTDAGLPESVSSLGQYTFQSSAITAIQIPDLIQTIPNGAFSGCTKLSSVTLPAGLKSIGQSAFNNCKSLRHLSLPDSLSSIGQEAFYLTNITGSWSIPDGVQSIAYNSLPSALTEIRFGTGLTSMSSYTLTGLVETVTFTSAPPAGVYNALNQRGVLSTVMVPAAYFRDYHALLSGLTNASGAPVRLLAYGTENLFIEEDGVLIAYIGNDTEVTVPDTVTAIGPSAFQGCSEITSVFLPDTVKSIGENAFNGCSSLQRISLSTELEEIGNNAFKGCTALGPALVLPEGLKSVGAYTFADCKALTSVSLPDTVESIGSYAFSGCTGLSGDLVLPSSLTTLGAYAFNGCTSLSGSLTLPEKLGILNSNVFYNTKFTGTLMIPDSVMSVNASAFYGNTGVTAVTFGSGLKTLSTAFSGCTGVTELTFTGTTMPTLSGNPFSPMTKLETIYVPAEAYEDYVALLTGKIGSDVQISTDMTRIAVTNLRAERVGSASAVLKWDAHVSGEAERYTVLRDGQALSETDGLTFRDSGLTPGQTYTYEVYGVLPDGGQTGVSKPIAVTPQAMTITDIRTGNAQNKVGLEHGNIVAYVSDSAGASVTAQGMLYYLDGESPVEIGPMPRSAELSTTSTAVFLAAWDIENVPDGDYTVRFVLTDEDGTIVQRDQTVTVDHTRPAQIAGLTAIDDVTAIHLTWSIAAELDTTAYRIYRRVQDSGEFRLIGQVNDRSTLSYVDRNVRNDRVYEYYVTGVSSFGQESLPSLVVKATLIADTTAPTVTKLTPEAMSWLTGSVTVAMKAEDDVDVARTELLYSVDSGETWEAFAFARTAMLTSTLNTATLPDGEIRIRALAWDAAGNESDPLTYTYMIDNTGPEAITGMSAESTSVTITLHWNDVTDDDISHFCVERRNETGRFVTQAGSVKALGLDIHGLTPDTDYTYRVVGYDLRGNRGSESEPITVRTAADTTAPVVTRILPVSGYYNAEIPLSITAEDDYNVASFTVQVSTDGLTWSDVDTISFSGNSSRRTLTYMLSLADLPEGVVSVRAVAADSAGNRSDSSAAAPFTQHMVDRTPPAAPAQVTASGGVGYVEVSWVQGAESDLAKYSVYRADDKDGEYVRVATGIAAVNWFDRTPEENVTYYYKVSVNDFAGNESGLSEAVSAQAENDTELPKIVSIYPEQGNALGAGYRTVSVLATDNRALDSILMEYSADGSVWSKAGELKNINAYSKRCALQLPLSALEEGKTVFVRVSVTDLSGNTVTGSVQYTADMTAPQVRTASAAFDQTEDLVTVTWTGAQETDLAGYRVYRSVAGASGEKLIAQRKAVDEQTEYTCKDVDISAQAVRYVYRVEAMDSCGNTASLEADVLTIPDRTAPKAVLECEPVQEVGVEYLIDASKSRDNGSIMSYQMDLGDGTVTDQPKIVHIYQETGEYTVTLTVTDNEGNVSVLTQTVTVRDRSLMGEAQILVLDDAGKPVPNAPVYFDLGEESQIVRNTDNNGSVLFTSGVGRHTVGCVIANNEWLPAKKDVIISANARAVVSITLVRQPVIEGEFEIERMTFDEIVAHGIDISAPENQHMLQVHSTLTYGSQTISTTFVYNEITGETQSPPIIIDSGDGEKRTVVPHLILPVNPTIEATYTSEAAVAFLDIPASASFLKEFFDVKLHIINNSASAFTMTDNTVTLNVPDGLSIVPSEATESNSVVMIPEIPGQTTSTISWILRGDRAGEYPLSADYSGILSEFNQTISARFEAEDPIKVYGLDAVKLIAEVNTSLDYDALYFGLSMQNVGEAEIYLPEISVMEDTISSQLNEDEANAVTVRALNTIITNASGARQELRAGAAIQSLRPGETLTRQYAAYGAAGENHVLQLRSVIEQIADSYGMPFEIIERKADLFSMDHAAEKLSAIAEDDGKRGEYDYILDNTNFFYVREALQHDEDLLSAVKSQQYQSAERKLNEVLNSSEQTEYAVQTIVLRLLRDDALAQTAETRVAGQWLTASHALNETLSAAVADALNDEDRAVLVAFTADSANLGNCSSALRREGLDGFTERMLSALEADGMSAEGAAAVQTWLESQTASDALSGALCAGSPMLTAAITRRTDLSFDSASMDSILMIDAVCAEARTLPALLSGGVSAGSAQAAVLRSMADALQSGTDALSARLMTALDACENEAEIPAAVTAVCGTSNVDTLLTTAFGELAAPDKIGVQTMLASETALSFALTKAVAKSGLAPKSDDEALNTLKALKYLITLRVYAEQTFADQADAYEPLQEVMLERINDARQSEYETVNAYACDVSADLLRYRDDLFASGRTDPNRPEAPVVTVNYRAGATTESFSSDYEYSFDGTHWIRCSSSVIDLAPGAVAKHLRVRLRETASTFAGNEASIIVAAKPRLQGDIQLVITDDTCTVSGLSEGVYAYAFTDDREHEPSFTGRFSVDASGSVTLSFPQPFLYLALERQADETHFTSLIRFAMQDNWLRDKENMFIIGIPEGTSYEDALDHYARLGLEAMITDTSGNPTDVVGTGSLVDLNGEVYEAVVRGDVDGDAAVDHSDLDLMLDHINYQQMLGGAYLRAAQATNEEQVGIFDLYEVFDYTETHTFED